MAPETYYYSFSLIFVLGVMPYLVNLLLMRTKGKTTFVTRAQEVVDS